MRPRSSKSLTRRVIWSTDNPIRRLKLLATRSLAPHPHQGQQPRILGDFGQRTSGDVTFDAIDTARRPVDQNDPGLGVEHDYPALGLGQNRLQLAPPGPAPLVGL